MEHDPIVAMLQYFVLGAAFSIYFYFRDRKKKKKKKKEKEKEKEKEKKNKLSLLAYFTVLCFISDIIYFV